MPSVLIASPKVSDAGSVYVSAEASDDFAAVNLQVPGLADKWRDDGLAEVYIECDLGSSPAVNLIALLGTNASASATYRVRGAGSRSQLTAAPVYDSGAGQSHWPQSDLSDWDETALLHYLSTPQSLRWWRIDITDTGNPDGYYQAGRLYVSAGWQPAVNYSWGAGHSWVNASTALRSLGGKTWIDERPSYRRLSMTLNWLTEAEAYASLAPIQRLRVARKDILIMPDPSATHLQERSVYGRLVDAGALVRQRQGISCELTVEELL